MADLATGQVADNLAALGATILFASNFELGAGAVNHGRTRTIVAVEKQKRGRIRAATINIGTGLLPIRKCEKFLTN